MKGYYDHLFSLSLCANRNQNWCRREDRLLDDDVGHSNHIRQIPAHHRGGYGKGGEGIDGFVSFIVIFHPSRGGRVTRELGVAYPCHRRYASTSALKNEKPIPIDRPHSDARPLRRTRELYSCCRHKIPATHDGPAPGTFLLIYIYINVCINVYSNRFGFLLIMRGEKILFFLLFSFVFFPFF